MLASAVATADIPRAASGRRARFWEAHQRFVGRQRPEIIGKLPFTMPAFASAF